MSHFATVQNLIKDLRLTPDKYNDRSGRIYNWLTDKKFSVDYSKKLIRVLNLWGQYVAKRQGSFFQPVKPPRGRIRSKIKAAQKDKPGVRRASKPLDPAKLLTIESVARKDHFNWLYLSLWLGLRPIEVDNLKDEEHTRIENTNGLLVLWVDQTKLADSGYDEERWKAIPIIFPEQKTAIAIMRSGNFKRPLPKTVANYLGDGYGLYAGRKGFTDLMISRGQLLDNISEWMGHTSTDTTRAHYKDRKKVNFTKVPGMLKLVGED